MSHNTSQPQFLSAIQIGRALAAMAVALQHTIRDADRYYPRFTGTEPGFTNDPNSWVELLAAGVDVFFVISGVVMVMSTWDRPTSIGLFLYRRAARIYPLYWLLTLAFIGVLIAAPSLFQETVLQPVHAACSLMLIPCIGPGGEALPYIYAGWTLSYELMFYVLFALSLLASDKWWRLVICIGLILLYHSLYYTQLASIPAIAHTTSNIILEFIYGLCLGYAYFHMRFNAKWALPLVLAGISLLLISRMELLLDLPRFVRWGFPACLIVAGLMCAQRETEHQPSWYRIMVYLGAASYSIYLFHFFSLKLVYVVAGKLGVLAVLPPVVAVVLAMLATIMSSILVYHLCEKPLINISKRLIRPVKPAKTSNTHEAH